MEHKPTGIGDKVIKIVIRATPLLSVHIEQLWSTKMPASTDSGAKSRSSVKNILKWNGEHAITVAVL